MYCAFSWIPSSIWKIFHNRRCRIKPSWRPTQKESRDKVTCRRTRSLHNFSNLSASDFCSLNCLISVAIPRRFVKLKVAFSVARSWAAFALSYSPTSSREPLICSISLAKSFDDWDATASTSPYEINKLSDCSHASRTRELNLKNEKVFGFDQNVLLLECTIICLVSDDCAIQPVLAASWHWYSG